MDSLRIGTLYKLLYVQQSGNGQWYQWQMKAVYLGYNRDRKSLIFSLRPQAGTTEINREYVHDVTAIKSVYARETVASDVALPKRFVGAVPPPSAINRRQLSYEVQVGDGGRSVEMVSD